MAKINWNDKKWQGKAGSILFEQLCYDVLQILGFANLKWRGKTPSDEGRDIECDLVIDDPIVEKRTEHWFVECKFSKSGISVPTLEKNIAWCDARNPDVLLIITNATLTNQARNWIDAIFKQKQYRFSSLEGPKLEQIIEKNKHSLRKYFEYPSQVLSHALLLLVDSDKNSQKHGMNLFRKTPAARKGILEGLDYVMNGDGDYRLSATKSISAILDEKLYPKDEIAKIVKPIYPPDLSKDAGFFSEDYVKKLKHELRKLKAKLRTK